jgi:hypothetical protein
MKKPSEDAIRLIRKDGRKVNYKLVVVCDDSIFKEMEYAAGKFSVGESKESLLPKIKGKEFAKRPMIDILDERFPELGLKKQVEQPKETVEADKPTPKKRGRKPKSKQ